MNCPCTKPRLLRWSSILLGNALLSAVLPLAAMQFTLREAPATVWFDQNSRSIRHVVGPSGGARIGDPVISDVDFASVSPTGRFAIVRLGDQWEWVRLLPEGAERSALFGLPADIGMVRWAMRAPCAAFFSESSKTTWKLCASDGVPVLSGPSGLGARVTGLDSLELSEDGTRLACIVREEGGTTLMHSEGDLGWSPLRSLPDGGTIAFRQRSGSLLVVDRSARLLSEIPFAHGYPSALSAAVALDLSDARSLALLQAPGSNLVAVLEDGRELAVYSLSQGLVRRQPLDIAISSPTPIGDGRYLARPISDSDPLQLLDLNRHELVFFVPASE